MSCAACSARVEKAVSSLSGVEACSVNLLTNSMTVEGSATVDEIIAAVENAGYGASEKGKKQPQPKKEKSETKKIIIRLAVSSVLLFALMYFSMMLNSSPSFLIYPDFYFTKRAMMQMLLALTIMIINGKFFVNGFKGLIKGAPNMDTLVALGSGASFVYSTARLIELVYTEAKTGGGAHILHDLYFESAAMILVLITVGKLLESISKGKTTDAIKKLMSLSPKTATVLRDGKETIISVDDLKVGDVFIV